LKEMVDANQQYLQTHNVGFSSFKTMHADMSLTPLPPADLLLTKDTLQHMPNIDIFRYLVRQQILSPETSSPASLIAANGTTTLHGSR